MTTNCAQRLRDMERAANDAGEPYELVDFYRDAAAHIERLERIKSGAINDLAAISTLLGYDKYPGGNALVGRIALLLASKKGPV